MPEKQRVILHCDCNGFFASCECAENPALKNIPMAVGGNSETRHGIILAKNEIAKRFGIRTAETVWEAKRKCSDLTIVPPRHGLYQQYSARVNRIYLQYTDLVEPFGIDESWLDITGSLHLFSDQKDPFAAGKEIADAIRERVKEEIGLTISVGVSFNKVFAKLGSDYKKPDATTVISRENYQKLLYPLPVDTLLFVGKSIKAELSKLRIATIGDLARFDRELLTQRLGKAGETVSVYARGEDDAPVLPFTHQREVKSVGNGTTFSRDLLTPDDMETALSALCDEVSARLRKHGLAARTIQIAVKDTRLHVTQRQKPLEHPTNATKELFSAAYGLLCTVWRSGGSKPVRALTVTCTGLVSENETAEQLSLFGEEQQRDKVRKIDRVKDSIRGKYGDDVIGPASVLKNDIGI